jgi:nucleoside-diphosphate-sugar epimerase
MPEALVVGAGGFLGRHLTAALLAGGTSTLALCRRPEVLADLAGPGLEVVAGDLREEGLAARLAAGVRTVFHLAARRNRPGTSPAEMIEVNTVATLRWAREAVDAGVERFLYVSTALVFGPSSTPLGEDAPLLEPRTSDAYTASKVRAQLDLRGLVAAGAPITTLLPTIVYGPDHPSRPNRVTEQIRRLLRRRFDIVLGGGRAERDLVHVDDVVEALLRAARRPAAVGREILLPGAPGSQRGLAETVARSAGRRPPLLVSLPVRPARFAAQLADLAFGHDPRSGWGSAVENLGREWTFSGARAREILNHQPRALERGVAETVAWIRRESPGKEPR